MLDMFLSELKEGTRIEVNYEVEDKGKISYAKMSKVHKCIRDIAAETGNTFEQTKLDIKLRSGLCIEDKCKSFAEISNEEMDLVIQECIQIGDFLKLNLR